MPQHKHKARSPFFSETDFACSVVGSDISSEEGSDTESFHSCLTDSSDDLDSDNDDFEEVGVSKEEDRRSKKDHEEASRSVQ